MAIYLGKIGCIAEIGEARYVCRILVGELLEKCIRPDLGPEEQQQISFLQSDRL
jgi:hypothetical protein